METARQAYADRAFARAWTLGGAYATDKEGLAVIDAWRCAVEEAKTMKSDPPPPLPRPAPRHKSVANAARRRADPCRVKSYLDAGSGAR